MLPVTHLMCCCVCSSDVQKFPLRMKDNDLLVTELYRDPTEDAITALSVYLTPKTSTAVYSPVCSCSHTCCCLRQNMAKKKNLKQETQETFKVNFQVCFSQKKKKIRRIIIDILSKKLDFFQDFFWQNKEK